MGNVCNKENSLLIKNVTKIVTQRTRCMSIHLNSIGR